MKNENNVTNQTEEKIQRWRYAIRQLDQAKINIHTAEVELDCATLDLAKFLVPKDASINEHFNIWFGDSLLLVKMVRPDVFEISWRTKGKSAVL